MHSCFTSFTSCTLHILGGLSAQCSTPAFRRKRYNHAGDPCSSGGVKPIGPHPRLSLPTQVVINLRYPRSLGIRGRLIVKERLHLVSHRPFSSKLSLAGRFSFFTSFPSPNARYVSALTTECTAVVTPCLVFESTIRGHVCG
jgi:hypothetical protein